MLRHPDGETGHSLYIEYTGGPLDMFAVGVINLHLQYMLDKAAANTLLDHGYSHVLERWAEAKRNRFGWSVSTYEPLVSTEIRQLQSGSLYEVIALGLTAIVPVASDPNVRAVLQGITANFMWMLMTKAVRGMFLRGSSPPPAPRYMPFDVNGNVRAMVRALNRAGTPGAELRIRHRAPDGEETEIIYRIPDHR